MPPITASATRAPGVRRRRRSCWPQPTPRYDIKLNTLDPGMYVVTIRLATSACSSKTYTHKVVVR
jgi:hypothetical protein